MHHRATTCGAANVVRLTSLLIKLVTLFKSQCRKFEAEKVTVRKFLENGQVTTGFPLQNRRNP
jgi:hypothetical protein